MTDQELRMAALQMGIESSKIQCENGDPKAMYGDILMRRINLFYKFLSDNEEVTFDDARRK